MTWSEELGKEGKKWDIQGIDLGLWQVKYRANILK